MTRPPNDAPRSWQTSLRLQLVVLLVAVLPIVVLLMNGACASPVPRPEPLGRDDPLIPGLSTPRTGRIDAIDAVWPEGGAVHVVWTEGPGRGYKGVYRLFYARALDGGARWSPPTELASDWTNGSFARVVQAEDGLHIFFSNRIRHLVSADGGKSWTERKPFLGLDTRQISSVDVVAANRGFCVAYLSAIPSATPSPQRRLTVTRLSLVGTVESSRDYALTGELFFQASLQFVAFRQSVYLFGTNLGFAYAVSDDGGRVWGELQRAEVPWRSGPVQMSVRDDTLVAVWGESEISVSQSPDGLKWPGASMLTGGKDSVSARLLIADAGSADGGIIVFRQLIYPQTYGPGPNEKIVHLYAASMRDVLAARDRGEKPVWPGLLPASAEASGLATVSNGKQRLVFWHDGGGDAWTSGDGTTKRIFFTPFPIADEVEISRLRAATVEGPAPTVSLLDSFTARIEKISVHVASKRWSAATEVEILTGPAPDELDYQIVFFVPGSPQQRWSTEPMPVPGSIARAPLTQQKPGGSLPQAIAENVPSRLYAKFMVSLGRRSVDVTTIPESELVRGAVRVVIDRKPLPPPRTGPDGPRR